jgi:hypothetical protein
MYVLIKTCLCDNPNNVIEKENTTVGHFFLLKKIFNLCFDISIFCGGISSVGLSLIPQTSKPYGSSFGTLFQIQEPSCPIQKRSLFHVHTTHSQC